MCSLLTRFNETVPVPASGASPFTASLSSNLVASSPGREPEVDSFEPQKGTKLPKRAIRGPTVQYSRRLIGAEMSGEPFPSCPAWKLACADLDLTLDGFSSSCLRHVASSSRLPLLLVRIAAMGESDVVRLEDPSGACLAVVPRRTVDENSRAMRPGGVLLLRQCSVFSPSPGSRLLNISPACVVRAWAPVDLNTSLRRE
jgi:hypothetical protein